MNSKKRRIWNFQTPFKRELFYHTIARTQQNTKSITQKDFHKRLFGKRQAKKNIFYPDKMKSVCQSLGESLDAETIRNEHSLFAYYKNFLTPEQRDKILDSDSKEEINYINSWVARSGETAVRNLRFCPLCAKEDFEKHAQVYPHIEWHCPGVEVCAEHGVYLEDYPFEKTEFPIYRLLTFEAERILEYSPRPCHCQHEKDLARMALEVLPLSEDAYNREAFKRKLEVRLREKGYCIREISVNYEKLYRDLEAYYGRDFLKKKGCFLSEAEINRNCWIFKLLRAQPESYIPQPYHWLMLINFLCENLEEFLSTDETALEDPLKYFESEQLVCPNPLCSGKHSPEFISYHCFFSTGIEVMMRCPDCKTIFSINTLSQKIRILQCGEEFRSFLNGLHSGKLDKNQTDIDIETLSYLQWTTNNRIDQNVNESRRQLKTLLLENPDLTRTQLQKQYRSCSKYLEKYDRLWYDQILPPKKVENSIRRDYKTPPLSESKREEKDIAFLEEFEQIYQALIQLTPPLQITKRLMISQSSIRNIASVKNYPVTRTFLDCVKETKTDFYYRICRKKAGELMKSSLPVTYSDLYQCFNPPSYVHRDEIINRVLEEYT